MMLKNKVLITCLLVIFLSTLPTSNANSAKLVITEVMQNPSVVSDANGEYLELYNPTTSDINLKGYTLEDNDLDSHTISSNVTVPSLGYALLCKNDNASENGGLACDYEYNRFILANGVDEVILMHNGSVVDRIDYDDGLTFPDPTGASMNLDPRFQDTLSNDNGSKWCESTTTFGSGDRGTPGTANNLCPGLTTTTTTSTTTTTTSTTTSTSITTSTTTTTQPPSTQPPPPKEIPEYPTAALPALIALGGYLTIRRSRKKE